ncbi:hypothetical protein R6Y95_06110 [Methanoculleus palmolei]|uniref:Type II toxin-antitoxin system ParD family antitoxin n=1 Tax=Methanoculleus palmolei TaxID=72612 RepID=A0ABD8A8X1_9EURY|nr:hypothetical protein R6Y95_06110 [Methanoculleus palmolei]
MRVSPYAKDLAGKIVETGKYGSLREVAGAGIRLLAEKEGIEA